VPGVAVGACDGVGLSRVMETAGELGSEGTEAVRCVCAGGCCGAGWRCGATGDGEATRLRLGLKHETTLVYPLCSILF
jgi:hypothetical protein